MKTIEYSTSGSAVADHDAEGLARKFLQSELIYTNVSTENFITAIRALIHEGYYPHTDIEFLFNGEKLAPNKNGRLNYWPDGFCDTTTDFLSRLMAPPK